MGFTKALYYPTIDIIDDDWLKSSILFWDEIKTIVPESIKTPYNSRSTEYLANQGVISPLFVSSDDRIVTKVSRDVLEYLDTEDACQILSQSGGERVHQDKLPREVIEFLDNIHSDKMSYKILDKLGRRRFNRSGWLSLDANFASYYMTLLANKLCEENAIALLTDRPINANFSGKIRLGNPREIDHKHGHEDQAKYLSQGMLTNLIINGVKILEGSSFEDVLRFKRIHSDELGLFRTNIGKLVESVSGNVSVEAMEQKVEDIYKDEFLPSYNNFKRALDGSKIKWCADNIMKVSLFSIATTGLPMALLGLSLPHAILSGAGMSLISSALVYCEEKREKISTSPYSYLLTAEREFCTRR